MDTIYSYRMIMMIEAGLYLTGSVCHDLVKVVNMMSRRHITTVTRSYIDHHHLVYNMKLRDDDVWVVTFPKCGTTWTQEVTWNILNGVSIEQISEAMETRSPFIDQPMITSFSLYKAEQYFAELESRCSPRTIKTHYPFTLLPPGLLDTCKVIFVCRNVKDVCVSYFHHETLMKHHDLKCDFITYAR